jgi:hypothetical protein
MALALPSMARHPFANAIVSFLRYFGVVTESLKVIER